MDTATEEMSPEQAMARLRWQCRRGMLELDAMLSAYLDRRFTSAAQREKDAFYRLLKYPDQELLEYLMGRRVPPDKDVADVAKQVQASAGP